jgi:hypothetical protein
LFEYRCDTLEAKLQLWFTGKANDERPVSRAEVIDIRDGDGGTSGVGGIDAIWKLSCAGAVSGIVLL